MTMQAKLLAESIKVTLVQSLLRFLRKWAQAVWGGIVDFSPS